MALYAEGLRPLCGGQRPVSRSGRRREKGGAAGGGGGRGRPGWAGRGGRGRKEEEEGRVVVLPGGASGDPQGSPGIGKPARSRRALGHGDPRTRAQSRSASAAGGAGALPTRLGLEPGPLPPPSLPGSLSLSAPGRPRCTVRKQTVPGGRLSP